MHGFFKTLTGRLIIGAVLWSVPVLIAGGIALSVGFRSFVNDEVNSRLQSTMNNLVGVSEIDADGTLHLIRPLYDSRFNDPYSGHYWQISEQGDEPFRSRSLWDQELKPHLQDRLFDLKMHQHDGPDGQVLRVLEQDIVLPETDRVFRYMVAEDIAPAQAAIARFDQRVVLTIALALTAVAVALVIQVGIGLQPIKRLRTAINDIRTGRAAFLTEEDHAGWGPDLEPVAQEIEALLSQNNKLLDRARTHVGNLAHALKTPLAVLKNDIASLPQDKREGLERQLTVLDRHITHHLKRARIAGGGSGPGIPVQDRLEKLLKAIRIMRAENPVEILEDFDAGLLFAGEKEDFDEVIGNILENASKWASSKISVASHRVPESAARPMFDVVIEDDGPGVPAEQLDALFERGNRLDEKTPGTGLGLAIVRDIVELYGGAVRLGKSSYGGLRVEMTLPLRR